MLDLLEITADISKGGGIVGGEMTIENEIDNAFGNY